MYAQIAAASGGRAAGVQRKVQVKCFMPGCGQAFYRTEAELAQPRSFANKFCKLELVNCLWLQGWTMADAGEICKVYDKGAAYVRQFTVLFL